MSKPELPVLVGDKFPAPFIYFSGASGTGKSTLAEWAAREYGLAMLPSVNSAVYRDHGVTFEQAVLDPATIHACQREIYRRHLDQVTAFTARGRDDPEFDKGFATDRGMDLVAYTIDMLGGRDFYSEWGLERLAEACRSDRAITFFVRPHPDILARARAEDGGRRAVFLADDTVRRIDGQVEAVLDEYGVPYMTIDSPRPKDRANAVRQAVRLFAMRYWKS